MISTIANRPDSFRPCPSNNEANKTPRILDPERFLLLGALTDWDVVAKVNNHTPRAAAIARSRGISTRIVQLRWLLDPALGYPSEPFKVWRRATNTINPQPIEWQADGTLFGISIVSWTQPQTLLVAQLQSTGAGTVFAFAGAPFNSTLVDIGSLKPGFNSIRLSGPAVQTLVLSTGVALQSLSGVGAAVINDPGWTLVEQVGFPFSLDGLFNLDDPQGLVSNLVDPREAALDRYRRGAPFYGWRTNMSAAVPAPAWMLAEPEAMIEVFSEEYRDDLGEIIDSLPPEEHRSFKRFSELSHENGGDPARTRFSPIEMLLFGAATDPLVSLITGFGTAFDHVNTDVETPSDAISDYMVTARYENGLDGNSEPVEYAAILPAPDLAVPPPAPTNVAAFTEGYQSPNMRDRPWRSIVRLSWNKIPDTLPFRVGSYAAARYRQVPAGSVVPLMSPRLNDDALQPISATTSAERDLEKLPLEALDNLYPVVSAPSPNLLHYGLAHQDLFGLWSPWTTLGHSVEEPAAQKVALLSARLNVVAPVSGTLCPASLVIDLAWDWTVRSPKRIELVGRLYSQNHRGDPPANDSRPNRLQSALNLEGGAAFHLSFNGSAIAQPDNHPTLSGTVEYLSNDGKSFLASPLEFNGTRRYRLTITGFSLDFANTGHIGLALWARGQENLSPQRFGLWTGEPETTENRGPLIVSASDPRPPIIAGTYENVLLASVADASGEHHARLFWPSFSGAEGYFVYSTTESKLRADRGMTEPALNLTLSERLAELRDAFEQDPNRQSFTRLNATRIKETQLAITLPRGTKEIHLYVVIGVGAGQIESNWPDASDPNLRQRPIAYAAPQIVPPAPPLLEVGRMLDESVNPPVYRAQIQIKTRPGATVSQVDLHRVRVPAAALTVDTMGPAINSFTGSESGWLAQPNISAEPGEAQTIGTLKGSDTPEGSWRPVFYRATAWSEDLPQKGVYRSRSFPSAAREIIIPPTAPPQLSLLTYRNQGRFAFVEFTSAAPVAPTLLGPHRIRASVYVQSEEGLRALYQYPISNQGQLGSDRLEDVTQNSGLPRHNRLWQAASETPGVTQYSLRINRGLSRPALRVNVQLIDPLGRLTERSLVVPAGV